MNNNPFDKKIEAPLWAITLLLLIPVAGIFVYQANMNEPENQVVINTPRSQIMESIPEKTEPVIQNPVVTEEVKPLVVADEVPVKEDPVVEEVKKEYTQAELEKIFDLKNKVAGTEIFYSKNLGIGFTYKPILYEGATVRFFEEGNNIYNSINGKKYDDFPSIEVFNKDPKITLKQAIEEKFLKDVDPNKCFVGESRYIFSTNINIHESAEILYEIVKNSELGGAYNEDIPWWDQMDKCPKAVQFYAKTNGVQYFLEDKSNPSKYAFIRVGQDGLTNDGGEDSPKAKNYVYSIRFLK